MGKRTPDAKLLRLEAAFNAADRRRQKATTRTAEIEAEIDRLRSRIRKAEKKEARKAAATAEAFSRVMKTRAKTVAGLLAKVNPQKPCRRHQGYRGRPVMNARTPVLKPYRCPQGVDPRTWRQSVETRLNDLLDRAMALITALDLMEVDCDLEDTADDEPSLLCLDDLEQDNCDDEDGGDAEPCPDIAGERIMWPDDMASQETLVRSGL